MRKEVIVAILLGFSIGLLVVFGIITARSALKKQNTSTPLTATSTTKQSEVPDTTTPVSHQLTINDPKDNQVVNSDKVTLYGMTTAGSTVVLLTEKEEFIAQADEKGIFSQEIALVSGANEVDISAYSPSDEKVDTTITIVYTTYDF